MKACYAMLIAILLIGWQTTTSLAQTSWKGTASTAWSNASNWTAGIPTATSDAIIGDANFTGSFQPNISASSYCKSLTVGGTVAATLSLSRNLTVSGNVTINTNGTVALGSGTITLTGNWINSGSFTTSSSSSTVTFNGPAQTLGGTAVTTFRKLKINTGANVTLANNVTVSGSSSLLTVSGTLNPAESPAYQITATSMTVRANAVLYVTAATFAGNYSISGTTTLSAGSIVDYSATVTAQTVSNTYTYSTLRISGAGTKTLGGNLNALTSSNAAYGNILVNAGTFDLSTFTANRGTSTTGGTISVANGATLKVGGTNTFPTNFNTRTLSLTSTVEYSGTTQTVAALTYGNLTLSSGSGASVKTFPATALLIEGNLTSVPGAGTSVSYTAGAALSVNGNMTISASTTFNGGSFTHTVAGNWVNNGTYTGSTGTITFAGAGTQISGSGTQNFNNISFTASNISAAAGTPLSVNGSITTTGPGQFIQQSAGTTTMTGTAQTITGTGISFGNLTTTGTVSTASNVTVTGNLTVNGGLTASAGAILLSGTGTTISGAGTLSFYALNVSGTVTSTTNFSIANALSITGSLSASAGTVTFTGTSSLSGTASLYNVTLNGTSLQLATNSVLGIANTYTVTAGTLDAASTIPNTVSFNGTAAQNVNAGNYYNLILTGSSTKTAAGAVTVNGDFTLASGATFNAGSFAHTVSGNWNNAGTFTAGAGNITFSGANASLLNGTTTFNTLTVNKTNAAFTLLNNVSATNVTMTAGNMYTGSNTLTITGTRTGTGIILGTITHAHAFTTGTAYSFEGPDNNITFSSVSGVTSITESIALNSIADFPFGASANRQYTISVPAGTYNATLRLHYQDAELNGTPEATMTLWNNNGTIWADAGKSANNTTNNYVEQTGLTNITGRWTFSATTNVVQWNGSASTDWGTAANWTVLQGSASTPPAAADVVQIGTAAFTNQPTITTTANARSIVFGSAQPATLTIGSGGSLTTVGNISGNWTAAATHTINAGAQTLTVNGNLQLSDGTAGHAINLTASTGTANITGSLTESGGANISFTGAGALNIGGDFIYTNGTFTAGTSTVTYNGTSAQVVAPVTYNNLTVNKITGTALAGSGATVNGNLNITAGQAAISAASTVTGNIVVSSGATLNVTNAAINIGGNLSSTGSIQSTGSDVNLTGSGAQTIAAGAFNNITINKPSGTATLTGNIQVNNNLTVTTGTLDLSSFTANRTAPGGTFTLANSTTLLLAGAANFPSGFGTYTLGNSSTVNFNGSAAQSVPGINYGNLSLSTGGTKTLAGSATVNGNLQIGSGATFDGSTATLSLGGNWTNSGTFTPSTSTVLLNGASNTITGNTTFNRVTVYGSYSVAGSDIGFNGFLNITPSGSYAAGSGTATVSGNLTNSGTLTSTGTTIFSGTTAQTIRFLNAVVSNSSGIIYFNGNVSPILNSTSSPTYANLVINNTAGVNASVGWIVLTSFTVNNGGIFNGGVSNHTISGAFTNNGTVTSSGNMNFNPSTAVTVNFGSTGFSSTGAVILGGTGQMTLSGTPTLLNAVIIANTNAAGITPPSGWTTTDDFTIVSNAAFNAGSNSYTIGGDITSNGTLNGGTSTFTMTNAAAGVSGSAGTVFRNFVIASGANITANSDFGVSGNFTDNGTYDGSSGAVNFQGNTASVIDGTAVPYNIAQIINNKTVGTATTLNKAITGVTNLDIISGTFDDAGFAITQNTGALILEDAGTLRVNGTNTVPVFSTYAVDTLSTVEYAGGVQSITAPFNYGNLLITGAGVKTVAAPLTILTGYAQTAGTFVGGAFTHLLAGNWNMSGGTFTNTGTTIQLNGTTAQDINSTGAFNNLTLNKPTGLTTISGNVTVNGALAFTSGKISIGANNLTMGTAGTISGSSANNYVIAIGAGSLVQQVVASGSKTYPVGTLTAYIPATVAFSAASTTDNISLRVLTALYRNGVNGTQVTAGGVNATWMITEGTVGGSDATVTLQWPGSLELPSFNRNACRLAHFVGAWDYGTANLSASGSDPYTISRSGINSFSPFAVGTNQVLPVTWMDISGKREGQNNRIDWSTAEEKNNDHFEVEFSTDGKSFAKVGTVLSDPLKVTIHNYSFLHENVQQPIAYYRIKQVDIDGSFDYSKVIRINANSLSNAEINLQQTSDGAMVSFTSNDGAPVDIAITDMAGRIICKQHIATVKGSNDAQINFSAVPGTYVLWMSDGSGENRSIKFNR
ncbi:hypothetical protein [Taibaiella soli]|uniref:Secretion system C-terminal sorting domain-containing protein n=1 Tax=Taibaiella soli TaxID=1649169 RepID=A0A2W2AAP5_9BACT|nr:hypothetical protein [Taibaiella soli]PZF72465.1 hypothetical protein DN068_14050 [Taibaiella soli]